MRLLVTLFGVSLSLFAAAAGAEETGPIPYRAYEIQKQLMVSNRVMADGQDYCRRGNEVSRCRVNKNVMAQGLVEIKLSAAFGDMNVDAFVAASGAAQPVGYGGQVYYVVDLWAESSRVVKVIFKKIDERLSYAGLSLKANSSAEEIFVSFFEEDIRRFGAQSPTGQ